MQARDHLAGNCQFCMYKVREEREPWPSYVFFSYCCGKSNSRTEGFFLAHDLEVQSVVAMVA